MPNDTEKSAEREDERAPEPDKLKAAQQGDDPEAEAGSEAEAEEPAAEATDATDAAEQVITERADDAPAAILPNGHFIFTADTPLFNGPTQLFDFDPVANTITLRQGEATRPNAPRANH